MADYQKMYYLLCRAASEAIDMPPGESKQLLQSALCQAEEIYVRTCGEEEEKTKSTRSKCDPAIENWYE